MFNTPYIRKVFDVSPEKAAIIRGSDSITFGGLEQGVDSYISQFIENGLTEGAVVMLEMRSEARTIAQLLALWELNCVVVLLPIAFQSQQTIEKITGAEILVQGAEIVRIPKPSSQPNTIAILSGTATPGFVLLSSGSTGIPKLVVHDFNRFSAPFLEKRKTTLITACLLLPDHIGGLNTIFTALITGSTLVFPEERSPSAMLRAITINKVNILPASPSLLNLLILEMELSNADLSHVKLVTFGTEPMPEQLLKRVKAHFKSARLIQTFGTSETGIAPGGAPLGDCRLKISDENYHIKIVDGELWIKSNQSAVGYAHQNPGEFLNDGWFRTGDIAEIDKDGFLLIKGRKNDWINVGGEKVLPNEIEEKAMQVEGVVDCTAYGIPNIITGEAVGLKVHTKRADTEKLKNELLLHLRSHLQTFKVPVKVKFESEMATTERFKKNRNYNIPTT